MHLIEKYALSCGAKISRPFILDKFYPLAFEKYITLHTSSKAAKSYDLWQDVVDILSPILSKENIQIVQIGTREDRPLKNCHHTQGTTSISQVAFLVKNSLLHCGADSFPVHISSGYGKKIVALYSNSNPCNCGPYWSSPEDCILLEPDRKGQKPSYSYAENPKTINTIKPEEVAASVCKLLGLDFKFKYKTLFAGNRYFSQTVEMIPNSLVNLQSIGLQNIIVRMDLSFNEEVLEKQLQIGQALIITNKPINLSILEKHKKNINQIAYLINEDNSPEFAKSVQKLGINLLLLSKQNDDFVNEQKIKYMDFGVIHKIKPNLEAEKFKNKENLHFKSSKFLISEGKIYPCESYWRKGMAISSFDKFILPVMDADALSEEMDDFLLFGG